MKKKLPLILVLALLCHYPGFAGAPPGDGGRTQKLKGTYSGVPRLPDDHVDLEKLLAELKDLRANTYNWLIWTKTTDWEDLQAFLPLAGKAGIKVWVTLVPHTESPPKAKWYSEPFRLDFEKWAAALGELSLKQPALVAWSVDDFAHNLDVFTPAYTSKITAAAKAVNPKLSFIPCLYYGQISQNFATQYAPFLDGVLFPYRAESVKADLVNAGQVRQEIDTIKQRFSKSFPVILDIYATAHSRLGASTPKYVEDVLKEGLISADGVFIYCHQDPGKQPEKYKVIRNGFRSKSK